jgi:hypothetical protein
VPKYNGVDFQGGAREMKTVWITLLGTLSFIAWGFSPSHAVIHNVSTSIALQTALDKAVAGDEIVLADGIYSGEFYIRNNSGTSSNPITVRATNKHKATMQGNNVCSRFEEGFVVQRSHWIIRDLKFKSHGRAISIYAPDVVVSHNIIDPFREEGVRVEGTTGAYIHDNVIAFGDGCQGDAPGIYLVNNADNNTVVNNIIFATGNNGYQLVGKNGYGMLIANNSDNNLVQGNLLFANSGKAPFRILAGSGVTADHNTVTDNAFLWGEGGVASDDCSDDSNKFINNISYGNYHSIFFGKGNVDGTKGHHQFRHNLFYLDDFARSGVNLADASCGVLPYKIGQILKDNLFYASGAISGSRALLWVQSNESAQLAEKGTNLFWAPGSDSSWKIGYTYAASDIHGSSSPPIFVDPANGDFALSTGSPGKSKASDGKDIGIEYNSYLKKSWMKSVFNLSTQKKDGLGTSASFIVDPERYYQVWFYIPEADCNCIETFNVEGQPLTRDINTLTTGSTWVQPGGPGRWITLGRHRATDGTLNIAWSNSSSAEKVFIRELPTADEAYAWISGASTVPPPSSPPAPTPSLAIPGRIEMESFNSGGEGIGYHDTTSANLGGAYRTSEAVDIKLAPGGVGYTVGYTNTGEWLKYNVNVAQSGNYSITVRAANGASTNGTLRIEVDGVNITGTISIPTTGAYSTEMTVTGPTVYLAQGAHTLGLYMEVGNFDLNWIDFHATSVGSAPPAPANLTVAIQ